jgi:cyanophycin synthetase
MNIYDIRTLGSPNIYHHQSVLRMTLDLEDLSHTLSCDLPLFPDHLVRQMPGLREHHCSRGLPGGFVERLQEGTYLKEEG